MSHDVQSGDHPSDEPLCKTQAEETRTGGVGGGKDSQQIGELTDETVPAPVNQDGPSIPLEHRLQTRNNKTYRKGWT